MNQLKPNGKRALIAQLLVGSVLAMDIFSLGSSYFQYQLLLAAQNGEFISDAYANSNDLRVQIISLLYTLVYVVSAVTFIQWFRRAYYNLHQKLNFLDLAEYWASLSWFIPFINLYRPLTIMKEMYVETPKLLLKNDIKAPRKLKMGGLYLWWGLWLLSNAVAKLDYRLHTTAENMQDFFDSTQISMLSSALGIPLALMALKVISDYAQLEPLLFQLDKKEKNEEKIPDGDLIAEANQII